MPCRYARNSKVPIATCFPKTMELREPRRKKQFGLKTSTTKSAYTGRGRVITGIFNGFSVILENTVETQSILASCCFGKGNLSRSTSSRGNHTEIIRKRQFNNRKHCVKRFNLNCNRPVKVIVVPDSDSENEECFKSFVPEYQLDSSGLCETVSLELPEAFFLLKFVKSLKVVYLDKVLDERECWETFSSSDKYFIQNYICYHHFRAKNWVVKPGIKFGGDYLLYKEGPTHYHASYVVIIDIINKETKERREDLCRRSMNSRNIVGLNRLCETTGKELLIFQILWPTILTNVASENIKTFNVKEIVMRRWDPKTKETEATT